MSNVYFEHELENGLHLLVEPMPGVSSAAFTFLAPAGSAYDPSEVAGCADLLSGLTPRGAGDLDSRALTVALDKYGVQRSESTEIIHTSYSAVALAKNLEPGLRLIADIVRRPRLEPEHLEFCKATALQELQAIEDEPSQKLMIELRSRTLPSPLGNPTLGNAESVARTTIDDVVAFHRRNYRPNGAILGVAGAVEFDAIRAQVERLFADWTPAPVHELSVGEITPSRGHLLSEKVQTQIGVSFPAVSYSDPDFFNAHGAVGVLSGGMSSRLFTEIREKRGLCYSVSASFHAMKDLGVMFCHCGTTNERAAESLEVLLAELRRLRDGITEDEVRRVKAGLKASLVMQEESTPARSSVLARGWYHLGRVRTLAEVAREIDRLSPKRILEYLERHPPREFTVLTLGPEALEVTV